MNLNGKLAELYFTMWLLRRGWDVFQPVDPNSPVDVVWRRGPGSPWRSAQVKKVYDKYGSRVANITRRDGALYDRQDVDYLACVDYEDGYLWLVPMHTMHNGKRLCEYTRITLADKTWGKYRRPLQLVDGDL